MITYQRWFLAMLVYQRVSPTFPVGKKSDRVQPVRPAPALDTAGDRAVPGGLVSGEVKSHGKEELLYPL